MEKIINIFEKYGGTELMYDVKNFKKPIIVENSEELLKSKIEKKIKKHPNKYSKELVRLKLLRYPQNKDKKIGFLVMVYQVDSDNELNRANENRQQGIFISNKELEKKDFKKTENVLQSLEKIMNVVYGNLINMDPFKKFTFTDVQRL